MLNAAYVWVSLSKNKALKKKKIHIIHNNKSHVMGYVNNNHVNEILIC